MIVNIMHYFVISTKTYDNTKLLYIESFYYDKTILKRLINSDKNKLYMNKCLKIKIK